MFFRANVSDCLRGLLPRSKCELFASFFRQGVSILVLDEAVQVEVRDALSDARLPDVEVGILLNSLPKVALQHGKADVALVLDFVLLNDVENHVIVLVQLVHGFGCFRERFEQQERTRPSENAGFPGGVIHDL